MNLANLLIRSAQRRPNAAAIKVGATIFADYRDLASRTRRIAAAMVQQFGLQRGDRVAIAMKNAPTYIEVLYGAWIAGLAAVPMNAKLHRNEFRYMLEHSGAKLCFATKDLASDLSDLSSELPDLREVIDVDSADYGRLLENEPLDCVPVEAKEMAWLFYTSGTTGRPKGAILTHQNLLAMTLCYFADVDAATSKDHWLQAAPMSHGGGLYNIPIVTAGGCQVIPESGQFDPEEIFKLLPQTPNLCFFAAPTMVKRLVQAAADWDVDSRNLKTVVYGGGPMYVADLKAAMARFGPAFVQIYGQGESPMTITALGRGDHLDTDNPRYEKRLASVGQAQSAIEVRIADEDGNPLASGEVGEVLVRGPSVMPGYWQNPEASLMTLRDGWLHTGDVGALDDEGYLTLMDRSKDVIISGGSNIYPREVEEVLLRHPAVLECSVVGMPHTEWGEEVVAFVVARPDTAVNETGLDALCLAEIARFKRPKKYRFVEGLPKNNYGKVLKSELRKMME